MSLQRWTTDARGEDAQLAEARGADDRNNRLLNFAVDNSDAFAELLSHAKADAEKSAIRDKAKQGAVYRWTTASS